VTSQDVVGADIVLCGSSTQEESLDSHGMPHSLCRREADESKFYSALYCGYTFYVRQLTQRKRRWSINDSFLPETCPYFTSPTI